ncbi:MAG: ArsR/SmtB family transcription factor [bacterium]
MPPVKKTRAVKKTASRSTARETLPATRKTVARRATAAPKRRPAGGKSGGVTKTTGGKNGSAKAAYSLNGIRDAANMLKQVSDRTRLQILLLLLESEHNVSAICDELGGQSQPAVSHHLAKLRDGRLIEPRREGKNNVYALTDEGNLLAQTVKSLAWSKS